MDHEFAANFHQLCPLFSAGRPASASSVPSAGLGAGWTRGCAGFIFLVLLADAGEECCRLLIMEFFRLNQSYLVRSPDIFRIFLFRYWDIPEIVIAWHEIDSLFSLFLVGVWSLSHDRNSRLAGSDLDCVCLMMLCYRLVDYFENI